MRCRNVFWTVAALLAGVAASRGQDVKLNTLLYNYDFFRLENKLGDDASRRDTEFLSLRLMPEASFLDQTVKIESHLVLNGISPSGSPAAAMVYGSARTWLPLDDTAPWKQNAEFTGYFDRLDVRIHTSHADVTVGRQAITWGVNTLWPALDLFAPFPATQIDRDYKPGVDAVRLTVPLGSRAEIDTVGAVLGRAGTRDGSGGALLRYSAGHADFGLMGGSFHGDTVTGAFLSASVGGTVLRGEIAWTRVSDKLDHLRRPSFFRGGIGLERQVSSKVTLTAEVAADGFGDSNVAGYPAILASDRMRRGEVGGLGRWHSGLVANWQFHPLGKLTSLMLVNCNDGSSMWIPWVTWSASSNAEILAGAQFAFGPSPGPGNVPRSEYGSYSSRLLIGFKLYL
jgi:hypothetical protein